MKQTAIRMYGVMALIIVVWLAIYPPVSGSGQTPDSTSDMIDPGIKYRVAELEHDIEKGLEKIEGKLAEKPKVIVKTKVKKVPVKVPRDSAAVWLRHPDGSVERIVFSTSHVPIINLVSDTISDTVKVRRKWLLFGEYRVF